MIVAREVFRLHFGKAREALAVVRDIRALIERRGFAQTRFLTDYVGEYYTLVQEMTFEDLAAYEEALKETMSDEEWRPLYARLIPLVRSGHREVFRTVD